MAIPDTDKPWWSYVSASYTQPVAAVAEDTRAFRCLLIKKGYYTSEETPHDRIRRSWYWVTAALNHLQRTNYFGSDGPDVMH